MAIPTCQKGEKSVKFGDFASDQEAIEALHEVDPAASEGSLCKEEGTDSYRAVLKKIDVAPSPSPTGDPKADLIFRILDKQNSILAAQMQLERDRADLAEVYKTRSGLKDAEGSKQTSTEKLLLGALSAAVSFGVVTELFKDGAVAAYLGYLALRGGNASSNLIYGFERYAEMKRLAMEGNLCGPLQGPDDPSEYGSLWKKLIAPVLVGGAATFGAIQLSKAFQGGGESSTSVPSAASSGAGGAKLYKNEELQKMDLSRLREIDSGLAVTLSALSEDRQKILAEAREVYREVYSLYLGELKSRDLNEIKDEELKAKAQEILAHGGGEPDPSFLEKLGVLEYAGIGIGFGIGTGVLHRFYNGVAPWRDFIDRRMNGITRKAREDAARRIDELKGKGVLSKCSGEPQPEKAEAKEKSAEENDLSFLYWDPDTNKAVPDGTMEVGKHFREFTEADYLQYLGGMVPVDMAETVDWKSVPLGLVSFLSPLHYKEAPREDRWKWEELLKNAETLLSDRYAANDEESALIRESVGKFAAAYRTRTQGSNTRSATDVNLMKWQMQWYVSKLEAGHLPTKAEVQVVLDLTATGRTENGLVAAYFTIQERAHNYVNLLAKGDGKIDFETATEMYWRNIDTIRSNDAALARAKAQMESEGYRPATLRDFNKRLSEIYFPSQQDAFREYFRVDYEGGPEMPVETADGHEVYVKDGDWYTIGPANDNAVELQDEAAFLPVAPMFMPVPIPATLPAGLPSFAI